MIRVLVVDDSAFARKVLRDSLAEHADIEVVDIARDGLEALEKIQELKPDVVTLDLVMPNLDGIGLLRALPPDPPRVVVVSISDANSELGLEALELGAITVVHKPTALATERLYELADELVRAVRAAATAQRPSLAPIAAETVPPAPRPTSADLVVIGTSTGGPQALTMLVRALPADLAVPVALVLHIPPDYTAPFAARLDAVTPLEVREAEDGLPLAPGRIVVARGGWHLKVERDAGELRARLDVSPLGMPHRPAVDVLFTSAAAVTGARTLGVVLTGMGDDGLVGARSIRAAGGRVITEAEKTCVVYGMPRAIVEAGMANAEAPLDELPALLMKLLGV